MTFYSKVGSFTAPAGTGSQSTTGLGFAPKAIIFWWGAASTGWTADEQGGTGFATASGCASISKSFKDGVYCGAGYTDAAHAQVPIYNYRYDGAVLLKASLTSLDSNGFTLNWSNTTNGYTIHYLALGGSDITGAAVVAWTQQVSGSKSITGVGFKPDFVMHMASYNTAAPPSTTSDPIWGFGAMDGNGNQWGVGGYAIVNQITCWTIGNSTQLTNRCLTGGYEFDESFVSMDSDGFTVTRPTGSGQPFYIYSLCLQGGSYQVGYWSKSTSAASDTITVSNMQTPAAIFVRSWANPASSDTINLVRLMAGASDGTNNRVVALADRYNYAPSLNNTYFDTSHSIYVVNNDSESVQTAGTIGSFAAQQFVASYSTHDSVATQFLYVAFGAAPPIIECDASCAKIEMAAIQTPPIRIDWTWADDAGVQKYAALEVETIAPTIDYPPSCKPLAVDTEISVLTPHVITDLGISSVGTGGIMKWSDPLTWSGGAVPGDGNDVAITAGDTVIFDVDESAYVTGHNGIVIHGTLAFATASPITGTALVPQTLMPCLALKAGTQISGDGWFYVGNSTTDPIMAAPVGASCRASIKCLGAPADQIITVAHSYFYGWHDLLNSTTIVAPEIPGSHMISMADLLILNEGDVIGVSASLDQGAFSGARSGRFTVDFYEPLELRVDLVEAIDEARLIGDVVAHVSRPILIETSVDPDLRYVALFDSDTPFSAFEGVWLTGGAHIIHNLSSNSAITACTIEGNYIPAVNGTGDIVITDCTVLNALTDPTHGALLDMMTGSTFIETCAVFGGNVGISTAAGIQCKEVTIQNTATAALSGVRSSLIKDCLIQGNVQGSQNGGHNMYLGCTLQNNVVDFMEEYEAECYSLVLGNPLSLGLPLGILRQKWFSNKSYDHNAIQTQHRVYCTGGFGWVQDLVLYGGLPTWEFVIQSADLPIYWDTEFLGVEGQQVILSVVMKKNFWGGNMKLQIIDPGNNPLYGFSDAALVETELPDEFDHWRACSVTFIPPTTKTYIARVIVQNVVAQGLAYAHIGGLTAAQVVGDDAVVPPRV